MISTLFLFSFSLCRNSLSIYFFGRFETSAILSSHSLLSIFSIRTRIVSTFFSRSFRRSFARTTFCLIFFFIYLRFVFMLVHTRTLQCEKENKKIILCLIYSLSLVSFRLILLKLRKKTNIKIKRRKKWCAFVAIASLRIHFKAKREMLNERHLLRIAWVCIYREQQMRWM